MNIKINNINKIKNNQPVNLVLFVKNEFKNKSLASLLSKEELIYTEEILKKKKLDKKIINFDLNSKKSLILVKVDGDLNEENLGANFFNFLKENNFNDIVISNESLKKFNKNFLSNLLHGIKLKSYEFNIYKSKKNEKLISINLLSNKNKKINDLRYTAIEAGTNFARDLVSEPPNVLYPKEYVNRLLKLKKFGIKLTVYNEKKLHQLGMHSLLGVGRGSYKSHF